MNQNDPELAQLRRLKDRSIPPAIDVSERVVATLAKLPVGRVRAQRWTMAACAVVCAATAGVALISAVMFSSTTEGTSAADLVSDLHEIDVPSLLR
jgi:hypothetical protein